MTEKLQRILFISFSAVFAFFFLFIVSSASPFGKKSASTYEVIPIEQEGEIIEAPQEQKPEIEPEIVFPSIENGKVFKSYWYGFSLKYPETFNTPISTNTQNQGKVEEFQYRFVKTSTVEEDMFSGFDVLVYNIKKVPNKKALLEAYIESSQEKTCIIEEQSIISQEVSEIDLEEITLSETFCHGEVYFFLNERERYWYIIRPIEGDTLKTEASLRNILIENMPEYFSLVKSFSEEKIVQKVTPSAPKPISAKYVNGKYVCAKENDKPKKSKKTKEKHLDMQCCLDPDEYPNPWCTYY